MIHKHLNLEDLKQINEIQYHKRGWTNPKCISCKIARSSSPWIPRIEHTLKPSKQQKTFGNANRTNKNLNSQSHCTHMHIVYEVLIITICHVDAGELQRRNKFSLLLRCLSSTCPRRLPRNDAFHGCDYVPRGFGSFKSHFRVFHGNKGWYEKFSLWHTCSSSYCRLMSRFWAFAEHRFSLFALFTWCWKFSICIKFSVLLLSRSFCPKNGAGALTISGNLVS